MFGWIASAIATGLRWRPQKAPEPIVPASEIEAAMSTPAAPRSRIIRLKLALRGTEHAIRELEHAARIMRTGNDGDDGAMMGLEREIGIEARILRTMSARISRKLDRERWGR